MAMREERLCSWTSRSTSKVSQCAVLQLLREIIDEQNLLHWSRHHFKVVQLLNESGTPPILLHGYTSPVPLGLSGCTQPHVRHDRCGGRRRPGLRAEAHHQGQFSMSPSNIGLLLDLPSARLHRHVSDMTTGVAVSFPHSAAQQRAAAEPLGQIFVRIAQCCVTYTFTTWQ